MAPTIAVRANQWLSYTQCQIVTLFSRHWEMWDLAAVITFGLFVFPMVAMLLHHS